MILSISSLCAQDTLFSPIEFTLNKQYNDKEELFSNTDCEIVFKLSNVFVYYRNDSSLIAYWRKGYLQEFFISPELNLEQSNITSIEFIDNNGSNDLILIKTRIYSANTHSAWTQWFENSTRWTIINLEYHSIVFDFDIKRSYYEEEYTYSEDITKDSIPEKEMKEIIETRKIEVVEDCGFEHNISIENTMLEIVCIAPCNKKKEMCHSNLKEGRFELTSGVYKKKRLTTKNKVH